MQKNVKVKETVEKSIKDNFPGIELNKNSIHVKELHTKQLRSLVTLADDVNIQLLLKRSGTGITIIFN